jgi:hypothetical protein
MKNQKKNVITLRTILLGAAALALVIVLVVLGLEIAGNGSDDPVQPSGGTQQTSPSDTTLPGGDNVPETTLPEITQPDDILIQTPYGELSFPGEWEKYLKVEQSGEPLQVRFAALLENGGQQELFTLTFGTVDSTTAGMLPYDGGEVALNVSVAEIIPGDDWTAADETIVWAMQEELNHILASLPLTDPVQPPQNQTEPVGEDIAIGTPYCELRYPSRWEEYLSIQVDEEDGYSVGFYCALEGREPEHLFTVHLGGSQGVNVMDLKAEDGSDVELRLTITEFAPDSSWSEQEKSTVFAMQEDLNYLLSALSE